MTQTMQPTARDLGIFIRDMIEDRDDFTIFDWTEDEPTECDDEGDRVASVDASNAESLLVYCDSGARLRVTIVREG